MAVSHRIASRILRHNALVRLTESVTRVHAAATG